MSDQTTAPNPDSVRPPGKVTDLLAALEASVAAAKAARVRHPQPAPERPICPRCSGWADDMTVLHSPQGCYGIVAPGQIDGSGG